MLYLCLVAVTTASFAVALAAANCYHFVGCSNVVEIVSVFPPVMVVVVWLWNTVEVTTHLPLRPYLFRKDRSILMTIFAAGS